MQLPAYLHVSYTILPRFEDKNHVLLVADFNAYSSKVYNEYLPNKCSIKDFLLLSSRCLNECFLNLPIAKAITPSYTINYILS